MTASEAMRDLIARELGHDRLHELDKPVFGGRQLSDKQIEEITDALLAAFPWLADEPRCCEHDKCPGGSLCCCQGPSDAEVEAAARALNAEGWTCYQGRDEPGNYDECEDCRRVCAGPARTVLVAAREARTT